MYDYYGAHGSGPMGHSWKKRSRGIKTCAARLCGRSISWSRLALYALRTYLFYVAATQALVLDHFCVGRAWLADDALCARIEEKE